MKEIMCIIRLNKVNQTKNALAEAGFPSITCRKVLGRGKKSLDKISKEFADAHNEVYSGFSEAFTEGRRLIAKRSFTIIVNDGEVEKAVETIINVNKTDTPGDGKIFVLPIEEAYRVRDGKSGEEIL
ncbi:nitrogen regulatory protein P-II [Clostridium bornimense]|uniref:Nitrogen regulatory protein P-II n=1 Tax=Clostridium bornimense TaxID=1216932 RepID=W6SK89_9CLOT|nr:P-II family nitrogen regulator [Clostridium bornimense]CDM70240.1 nitrogen regulatory protein P-II [Clostridium bornimense]